MGLRFRQCFEIFPGVRLNLSGSGITASFGVDGATVNVGPRGVRSTVGIPGSGLSFTTNHTPAARPPAPNSFNAPRNAYFQPETLMREINSESVENLTSHSLIELRDMIAAARVQKVEVDRDLTEARDLHQQQSAELNRRQRSLFRRLQKRRIAELEAVVPQTAAEVERLTGWQATTRIDVSFETTDVAQRAYGALVRAFDTLRQSKAMWDVTSDRDTDRVRERSTASRTLSRNPVKIDFATSDLVRFDGKAMRFGNVNGEDILIYPGVVIMPRADGAFALIELRDVKIQFSSTRFIEEEAVPLDAVVVDETWAKVNKNGTRDLRFRENYRIPIVHYGRLFFTSPSGVREEYQFSKASAADDFSRAFEAYRAALAMFE